MNNLYALVYSEEGQEYIEIGTLNGLFVLGRTMGFIGKFYSWYWACAIEPHHCVIDVVCYAMDVLCCTIHTLYYVAQWIHCVMQWMYCVV